MWGNLPSSALVLLKVFRDPGTAQFPYSHAPPEEISKSSVLLFHLFKQQKLLKINT